MTRDDLSKIFKAALNNPLTYWSYGEVNTERLGEILEKDISLPISEELESLDSKLAAANSEADYWESEADEKDIDIEKKEDRISSLEMRVYYLEETLDNANIDYDEADEYE